ncbi:SDR family oxidoreductase [Auraticoccus monumenti]|uniref:Uncharacterized conserved protein YbjT, contains NAD(P)-binding and DUF2867 domains n=1 Tax=Auraticoccus monumenti TaxID=675864 RepID=A0A1G7BJ32_9ACTN|nr:SDR family oxidoreductase [Auraticoccus monumenti]SDE27069.1 Uncharacterized conserved protein YbjT, contains NAD(P)-binding and DUF2867 domains [Auraticoccus monumenti]
MTRTVAVTGSTGALGGMVVDLLGGAGVVPRLLVRDPSRAPDVPGAEVRVCEYGDATASRAALEGVDVLLMVSGSESADRLQQHRTFLDAAAAVGVGHVVYTSFQGAAPNCTFTLGRDHHATEEHLRASGMAWTFLRDSFYADFLADLPDQEGVIRGPAGDGSVAAVARADVAEVAAVVLQDPDAHRGLTHDLTGPGSLTLDEVAGIISEHRGTPVRYHAETVEEAYASRLRWPAPQWQYDAWVSTYTAIARGEVAAVSDAVERITGRPATSLAELLGQR